MQLCTGVSFLLLLFKVIQCANSADEINIGAILDLDTFSGKEANVALQLVLQDVNENSWQMENNTHFSLHIQHSGENNGTVLELFRNEVVAIILQDPEISQFLDPMAEALEIPLLSLITSHAGIENSRYLVSTAASDYDVHMSAIAALVKNFRWEEAIVIYEDGELWMSEVFILNEALQQMGKKISQIKAVPSIAGEKSITDLLQLLNTTYVRAFIVHTSVELALRIFSVADELGLVEEGYAWVVTEPVAASLDYLNVSSINTMQGIVGVRRSIPQTTEFVDFEKRFRLKFSQEYGDIDHPRVNGIVLDAYEALWIISRAVSALDKTEISFVDIPSATNNTDLPSLLKVFTGGQSLVEQILRIKSSVSINHPLKPNSSFKNPAVFSSSYEIVNMAGRNLRTVGCWTKDEGFTSSIEYSQNKRKLPKRKLSDVIWPGGSASVPSGYRKLLIGVTHKEVFTEFYDFCKDMFEAAIKLLPYNLQYEYEHYNTSDYKELVSKVAQNRLDGLIGGVAILPELTTSVDFTQPYTDTGLMMMVPRKKVEWGAWSFLHPFTPSLWGITGALFTFTAFLVWLLEHNENRDFGGKPTQQIATSLSFSFSTLVFAQREKVMSSLGRGILATWLFAVYILNNSYAANLSSILTAQKLSSSIPNMERLSTSKVKVGYHEGSFVKNYLMNELNISSTRLVSLEKPEDYVQKLKYKEVGAIVDETPYIQLVNSLYCGSFAVVDQAFDKGGGFGFIFRKGSPFVSQMSTAVLNLTENRALVQSIRSKWLGDSTYSCPYEDTVIQSKDSLSPKNLWTLFVLTAMAYTFCGFIFIGRNIYKGNWRRRLDSHDTETPSNIADHDLTANEIENSDADESDDINHEIGYSAGDAISDDDDITERPNSIIQGTTN